MHKVAQAITAFMGIVGCVAMVLLLSAIGFSELGENKTYMAKNVAFVIGISKFQLGVYSSITMVFSFFVAALLSRKSTPPERGAPSTIGDRKS